MSLLVASVLLSSSDVDEVSGDMQTVTVFRTDEPVSTVSGSVVNIPTSFLSQPATNTMQIGPLLTGTCTDPYFADVTNAAGVVLRYPQIGCSPELLECCPFGFQDNISLIICPADHYRAVQGSYTACCPTNFDLLYTGVGFQTPCYSNLSTYLVPNETTSPNVWLVTASVFARSYQLIDPKPQHDDVLAPGAIAGLVVGLTLTAFALVGFGLWWFVVQRRRLARSQAPATKENSRPAGLTDPDESVVVPPPLDSFVVPPQYSPKEEIHMVKSRHQVRDSVVHELPSLGEHPVFKSDEAHQEEMRRVALREAGLLSRDSDWTSEPRTPAAAFQMLRDPENKASLEKSYRKHYSMSPTVDHVARASLSNYYSHDDLPSPLS